MIDAKYISLNLNFSQSVTKSVACDKEDQKLQNCNISGVMSSILSPPLLIRVDQGCCMGVSTCQVMNTPGRK